MQMTRRAPAVLRSAASLTQWIHARPISGARLSAPATQVPRYRPWIGRASFSHSARLNVEGRFTGVAKDPHEENNDGQQSAHNELVAQEKEKQTKAPWHREGSNTPPVAWQRSAGAMTKGKLLTTPSRLLKLIIPLTTLDRNTDRKDVEPLALLVHPQQPLSYLERLIQSELPTITTARGEEKVPAVHFRAEDTAQDEIMPGKEKIGNEDEAEEHEDPDADLEDSRIDGKTEKTGKLNRKKKTSEVAKEEEKVSRPKQQSLGEGSVERYSGLGREGPDTEDGNNNFVRWSPSTEIGDFIRDAARGKEFAVEIEGAPEQIRIGVPSFNDRTHYLRHRLRKTAAKIMSMAEVKKECDMAAHKGAQRVAMGGAGLLVGYWYVVYRLTFETDLGWDTMEPVTYLVGLSTLICGYLWFLYHNREVSYRAALNLTISRRQTKLYNARGFDLQRWESLIEEGNSLRKEIKQVASEYDVEWDERADEKDEKVTQALKVDRDAKKGRKGGDRKKGKEDEDEEE
ncbi:MAG: hypothetical protein LQ346_005970 [Caloplaca aetnensis]|nr:MAG: hypothetical protein LQ346_005970 [Caloplaca aetnensis]